MEQIDTVQTQTVKVEETEIKDIPLITDSKPTVVDKVKTENVLEESEPPETVCVEHTIENTLSVQDDETKKENVDIENKQLVSEQLDEYTIIETKDIIIEPVATTNEDQHIDDIKVCKEEKITEKVEKVNCESECASEEKGVNVSQESEADSTEKDTTVIEKNEVCTVTDIDTTDDPSVECQALLKSFSQDFEAKEHSSEIADADLTKLVDGNSEIVVLTVETVPITESNKTTHENYVVTVHEENVTVSRSESNILSLERKEDKKSEIVNEEFDLIDYSQESDGTIIEVISTEVVQSEDPETYTQQDSKEDAKSINVEPDLQNSTDVQNISSIEVIDNTNESKEKEFQENLSQGKEDKKEKAQVETIDRNKTEDCDSSDKNKLQIAVFHNKPDVSPAPINNPKNDSISTNELTKVIAVSKKRSVIQDIFDDWGDENIEDESQITPKSSDKVEIELKTLLDDAKTSQTVVEETVVLVEEEIVSLDKQSSIDTSVQIEKSVEVIKEKKDLQISNDRTQNQNIKKQLSQSVATALKKDQINFSTPNKIGKSPKCVAQDSVSVNQTPPPHIPIVSRGRNLSSQIASQAEVTEALKERLREKQKIVEPPRGPDIFFVKKLTQRLSSKLAGGPVSPIPALLPLPHPSIQSSTNSSDQKTAETKNTEVSKEGSTDNKELLAILEGDVDPDWSNLKPPTLTEEGKTASNVEHSDHSVPPKLDPLVERELALKQLLELPVAPMKRNSSRKKKVLKPPLNKASKETEGKNVANEKKEVVNIDAMQESTDSNAKSTNSNRSESLGVSNEQHKEKDTEMPGHDVRLDESRSGRKRKPTEKAREHEQNTTKRQKVYKGKISLGKKQATENDLEVDNSSMTENHHSKENALPISTVNNEDNDTVTKEAPNKDFASKVDTVVHKPENSPLKRPKQSLTKKGSQPIAKRKMVVKKLLRQNISANKKSVTLKAKLSSSPKKSGSKIVAKSQKRTADATSADAKPKKKIINEIDRLLQDEGVVNLLYDVEQPDKKRLIPITKSQAKVMDIQKVQRELKIRKKLVRNAVLRLRTSSGVTKVSPRSKRTAVHDAHVDKKIGEQVTSLKPVNAASSEFILPAKIRNAADASIIIRRHSSSSFSSASGSPRVSVDGPERSDGQKLDDGSSHSLRSTKRRHSQDERINVKKSKKKAVTQKTDVENAAPGTVEEKSIAAVRSSKKAEPKKADKGPKQVEAVTTDESNSNSSKVITRSNGTTTEAATALSVVNAGNRSGSTAANRKNKVNANVAKTSEQDGTKTKTETRNQFSNKEINVRRHGNLVQLILTPSSTTKLRNALTLQLMQEFRETLSILKKDDECRVVLLTSTGTSFCEGLELSILLHTNKEERRLRAQELADGVKDFIKSLASFNKPIVAGVQGAAVGLGVTMLPLFDLVIASDKATFSTPYGKLGQIAEGAAVFTLSHILGSAITSELLLGGRTLTASEALRAGLVTRVLWPDRFQVELLPTLRAMSEQSSQSMEATKALLRHSLRKKLDAALESETYLLIQHWCSAECQNAIKAYMDGKVQ